MMDNSFEIPVIFNGKELLFKSRLVTFGYIHKFEVDVDGEQIIFEPDEEGQYRAISLPSITKNNDIENIELIKKIAEVIQIVTK